MSAPSNGAERTWFLAHATTTGPENGGAAEDTVTRIVENVAAAITDDWKVDSLHKAVLLSVGCRGMSACKASFHQERRKELP